MADDAFRDRLDRLKLETERTLRAVLGRAVFSGEVSESGVERRPPEVADAPATPGSPDGDGAAIDLPEHGMPWPVERSGTKIEGQVEPASDAQPATGLPDLSATDPTVGRLGALSQVIPPAAGPTDVTLTVNVNLMGRTIFLDDERRTRALAKEIKRLITEDKRRGLAG